MYNHDSQLIINFERRIFWYLTKNVVKKFYWFFLVFVVCSLYFSRWWPYRSHGEFPIQPSVLLEIILEIETLKEFHELIKENYHFETFALHIIIFLSICRWRQWSQTIIYLLNRPALQKKMQVPNFIISDICLFITLFRAISIRSS